ASARSRCRVGAQLGATVSAVREVRIFGRKVGKRREFELMEKTLAKLNGPELAPGRNEPAPALPAAPPSQREEPKKAVASAQPAAAPPAQPATTPVPPTGQTTE